MPPNPSRKLFSILLTLELIIACEIMCCKSTEWSVYWRAAYYERTAHWTPLGAPPEKALFIQYAARENSSLPTTVKSANGKFYAYRPASSPQWVETTWPYPEKETRSSACQGLTYKLSSPTHTIIDCDGSVSWEMNRVEDLYAVLDDGSVWRWQYGNENNFTLTLSLYAAGLVLGVFFGFLFSKVIQWIVFRPHAKARGPR